METIKKVVVAIDDSELSKEVIDLALHFATIEEGVELLFLHVIGPTMQSTMPFEGSFVDVPLLEKEVTEAEFREVVETRMKECGQLEPRITINVVVGTSYDKIAEFAEEMNADLIMIGHHSMSSLEEFFQSSVAANVVAHSPCSVYVHMPKSEQKIVE